MTTTKKLPKHAQVISVTEGTNATGQPIFVVFFVLDGFIYRETFSTDDT